MRAAPKKVLCRSSSLLYRPVKAGNNIYRPKGGQEFGNPDLHDEKGVE